MDVNGRCRAAVLGGFMDLSLALGAVASNYRLPDEAVWDLARAVDQAHEHIQMQVAQNGGRDPVTAEPRVATRHPAIGHLLQRLERTATCSGGSCDVRS